MIGFINVLKPTGVSSGYVVNRLKHVLGEKVGHLGTLDPLASGVLPVAVGKATRFFNYFLNKDKEYVALMKINVETETLDSEGQIKRRTNVSLTESDLRKAAEKFVGEIMQIPPIYSAKMVGGKRAYELAKEEKETTLAPKKVQIYSLNVEKWHQNDIFRLKIHCSAGTYVRSIVRDIAASLGCVATAVAIIRTRSGPFSFSNSLTLEEACEKKNGALISVNDVLKMKTYSLSKLEAKALMDGKHLASNLEKGEYLGLYEGKEFALLRCDNLALTSEIYLYDGEKL